MPPGGGGGGVQRICFCTKAPRKIGEDELW